MSGQSAIRATARSAVSADVHLAANPSNAEKQAATEVTTIRRHRLFLFTWYVLNVSLVCATLVAAYCIGWEYSTRRYLKGFSDAIIPLSAPAEEKVQAILSWMAHGPGRQVSDQTVPVVDRDPTDTLNYESLLQVCGTATNAFINLADSGGLAARRLLLLGANRGTVHVVAEILIDGRWIIVDPAFRAIPRGANGELLTAQDLADPKIFATAIRAIPHYDPTYTFQTTVHVRVSRVRYIGLPLREVLDHLLPGWENSTTMSLLLERKSMADMVIALIVVFCLLLIRTCLRWFGERRMGLHAVRIRAQVWRAVTAFLDTSS